MQAADYLPILRNVYYTYSLDLSQKPRVIIYGALGQYAKRNLSLVFKIFENFAIELWDKAGDGIKIKKPDFSKILENDIVVVLVYMQDFINEISEELRKVNVNPNNIIYFAQDVESYVKNIPNRCFDIKRLQFIDGEYIPNPKLYELTVDIVIPVYNAFDCLVKCLESVPKTKMKYRLIVVDDCSPDERVWTFLVSQKEKIDFILLKTEKNLGFPGAVNLGLKQCKNHVVLLNTDVIVPDMWLERLITPILLDDKIASVTPFTGCSELIGIFKNYKKETPFPSVDCVDEIFKKIKPQHFELPWGEGCCMAMNYRVIQKIGLLDDITYAGGYGEEVEWCLRAYETGYKNVVCDNMYVYHKINTSYDEKDSATIMNLRKKHAKQVQEKYPASSQYLLFFFKNNPILERQIYAAITVISKYNEKSFLYIVNDNHSRKFKKLECKKDFTFCLIFSKNIYYVEILFYNQNFSFAVSNLSDLNFLFSKIKFEKIYIEKSINQTGLFLESLIKTTASIEEL